MSAEPDWGHHPHPLLNHLVEDIASGRRGMLRAVMRTDVPTHTGHRTILLAHIAPPGGGREWTTAPSNVHEVA